MLCVPGIWALKKRHNTLLKATEVVDDESLFGIHDWVIIPTRFLEIDNRVTERCCHRA
jgi:hypothetical protein